MDSLADATLLAIAREGHLNPVQKSELEGQLQSEGLQYDIRPGPSGTFITPKMGSLGGGASDVTSLARQMIQLQQEAAQPAITSLQASIPETSARFATERTRLGGEREPLKQRYQNLLDEITRREKVDVSAQERVTSREFGRRGIPLSSGFFDTSFQEAVSPLRQFYTGQTRETGLGQEEGLRGIENLISSLTGQETESQRAISNAIAQLQAGGSSQGIQNALALYQQQQQAQQQAAQFALQQQLAERAQSLQEEVARRPQQKDQFATLGEGSTLFNLLTGKPLYTAPKTYKSETTGTDLQTLQQILGGQKTQPTAPPLYFKPLSTSYQQFRYLT